MSRRKRQQAVDDNQVNDEFVTGAMSRASKDLYKARQLRRETEDVLTKVKAQHALNHWADTVRSAMGARE